MNPERVTQDNVIWIVDDHERRLTRIEERTEDFGVFRRDLEQLTESVTALRAEVAGLRTTLVRAAVTVATSSVMFAATLFVVWK